MIKDKDSKQSIQVTVRVRPLSEKELNDDPRTCVTHDQTHTLQLHGAGEVRKFTFDTICFNESQEEIFERVGRKCTLDCLEGYNCTIFAYGQTGAGKTYTMMGVNFQHERYYQQRGLIPRTMQFLFQCIQEQREAGVNFIIHCSFLEIYNEQIIDLLNKCNTNLQLREDTRKGVYVEGLTDEMVSSSEEAMDIVCKGSKSRHVGSTFYNEASSRSHSVFTMQIESRHVKNGVINTRLRQFNFIDLAGSERTKQSTGERLKEGCNINKSLMNLATVINALSEVSEGKSQHVNYRNSKLTFLLKDSLGGNSRTNLIANISPATSFYQETLSTLGFARRAKLIKRDKACINQDSSGNIESMKNEIKRLKQQIITLMSQQSQNQNQQPSETPSQMTTIMHQYVSQQIEKQTKLQIQILKLNDRIVKLQTGIKQYSNSDTHLRMIITVYEDKINRLKEVQKILAEKVELLSYGDEHTKTVIEYFKAERTSLIKEIDALKKQACGSRFLRELLKEAQVIKEQGEDNSIKDLLSKNTIFLASIHSKLNDIHQQKKVELSDIQMEKKIVALQRKFIKKEEESSERIEQLKLQLNEFKNRNEQNQKLLEETVGFQIILEQKAKEAQKQIGKWISQVQTAKDKAKNMEKEIALAQGKGDQIIVQLKQELSTSKQQITMLKNQIVTLQNRLQKSLVNETILKQEFHALEEQKYKMDKMAFQNIDGMKDYKNMVIKYESEIAIMQEKIQALLKENHEGKESYNRINEQFTQEKKVNKTKIQQLQQRQKAAIQAYVEKQNSLISELEEKNEKIITLEADLAKFTDQLNTLKMPFMLKQHEFEQSLNSMENSMELIEFVQQKYVDYDEMAYSLDKTPQLQNKYSENDCNQIKLKRSIDDLKEKLSRQKSTCELLEIQASQKVRLYDKLNQDYQSKKRQALEMSQTIMKLSNKIQNLQDELEEVNQKRELLSAQLQAFREKDKDHKIAIVQIKNELIVVEKNREIQIQALNSQIVLKDQQIEQLEKEVNKNKAKFSKQILELEQELIKNKEMFQNHEESIKQSMENHLTAKEKKLIQMKTMLQETEHQVKIISAQKTEAINKIEKITSDIACLESEITAKTTKIASLQAQLSQKLVEMEELKQSHNEQLQELQIIHGHQIDQKNEQIEAYMNENETINSQLVELKQKINELLKKGKQLKEELAISNQKYHELNIQNQESSSTKEYMSNCEEELKFLKNQISEYQDQSEQATENILILVNENERITRQYSLRIMNLDNQNELLRFQKEQLENYEQENKQQFVESSKQINQLTKALQKERQSMYQMVTTQRSMEEQIKMIEEERNNVIGELKQLREERNQQIKIDSLTNSQISSLRQQKQMLTNANIGLEKAIQDLQVENKSLYEKLSNYSETMNKTANSLQSISVYKQKSEVQNNEIQKMKSELDTKQQQYSKLFNELCQERDNENNYKAFIDNLQTQITQLEFDLQEKDAVYKKLVEKIAKNQNDNKKAMSSEHYQKTSDLLQKSRAEQLQLRRQNDQYKRATSQLRQDLEEKDRYVKQVETKSQTYCITMHKKIQQIQTDYVQLQNKQQKLLKQKRILEKQVYDNEMLRASIAKLSQRNEELQSRLKKITFDYNQLQTQFNEGKKGPFIANSNDEKTVYINRLKAEINALKNEKMLIVESLSKEREQKTRLKAGVKYGKDNGDVSINVQMEKKINENKNLQQLIFEIINQLKISVLEPKTKLQAIRSIIMGTIKERNNQMKFLRQKVKQYERELQQRGFQIEQHEGRQLRSLNISNVKNMSYAQDSKSISKQKQGNSIANSRQRMKQFQNYYARFRQAEEGRGKN